VETHRRLNFVKIDLYTKCVLTVIAVCLLWITVRPLLLPPAVAATGPIPVYIDGISALARLDVNIDQPVQVSDPVSVHIDGISSLASLEVEIREPLQVEISRVSSLITYPLPVRAR
jgi:hypothetical protein